MKKPIAVAVAVAALAVAGTAVAAPGGGPFGGGDSEERQAGFAADLAGKLDGVYAAEVEKGLEQLHAEREAEMLDGHAEALTRGDSAKALPRQPVELTGLVGAAVGAAERHHPGHTWRLELPESEVEFSGWPDGLNSMLDNLL